MIKIRDLGINVIPATMRPPEIGLGGAVQNDTGTCVETCGESCEPSGQCVPSCDGASAAPRSARGFSHDAIAQLRQQLQNQLSRQF
jgi:hypothetical protein